MHHKGTTICILIGLLLCVGIWIAVPYNNFALNNSFVSDGYLPEIVLFGLAILVLVLNPLLRRWWPRGALSHRHLALLTGMMLFAAVLPSNGLFRFLPHCLAFDTQQINASPMLAEAIGASRLPPALFPDAIGLDVPTPVSDQLLDELDPEASIPWSAWRKPLLAWGTVVAGFWLMMIGLGAIVYPQWRDRERLAFPLLKVYHAIIDEPAAGALVPPVFRAPFFWVGCGVVFFLHSCNGLAIFTQGSFPGFPLSWDITDHFTDGVWREAPGFLKGSRLYFVFIGLAYFMPNRYSFSIWFTVLFFGLFVMVAAHQFPTFKPTSLYNQGNGALIAITGGVLWLGRRHYLRVGRAVFRRSRTEDEKTDALAGRMFLGGCTIMLAWFVWAGAGVGWSLFLVAVGVMIMLVVARIVAETGLTYVWIMPLTAAKLIGLFPQKWLSVSTAFLQEAHYILANRASAVSVAVMMMLSLGLNRKATPASHRQLAGLGLGVLLAGLLVCGAVHLNMGYNLSTSYDGKISPITGRGAHLMGLGGVTKLVAGQESNTRAAEAKGIVFGIALAGTLLFLCARFPAWPLHPIGLIFVYSSIGLRLVTSLFIGWLLKALILKYAGGRAYRAAMPLFLGLIFGEVFANAFWTLVPVIQLWFGIDPSEIQHMTIFQYT